MPIPVFGLQDDSKVFKEGSCLLADENFVLIGSFVAFFIPLTIMVITYFLTIKSLQKEATLCVSDPGTRTKLASFSFLPQSSLSSEKLFQRSIHREPGSYGRRTMQSISNEQKACKVLGIVFFLFVVMWCPFFITNIMAVICKEACNRDVIEALLNVFVWIGYLSSAVNPLVYTLFNKTYRSAFSRYIQCQYKENKKPLQLILVNTIPALAYKSSQLQMGPKKNSKKDDKTTDNDCTMVALGKEHPEDAPADSSNTVNEKVNCVWWAGCHSNRGGQHGVRFPSLGGGKTLGDWRKLGQSSGTNNNIYMPHFILSMKSRVQYHKTCTSKIFWQHFSCELYRYYF